STSRWFPSERPPSADLIANQIRSGTLLHVTGKAPAIDGVAETSAVPPACKESTVPITRLLVGTNFTPEQQHVLKLAFSSTLRMLNLVDRNDPICEIVARKVIEIGATGITDDVAISEIAFHQLGRA